MSHNASVIIPIIPLLLCDTFSHSLKKQSQIYSWRIAHTYTCVLIQSFSYSLSNSSHDRAVHWSMGHTLEKTGSPYPSSQQLLIAPQLGLGSHEPIHIGILTNVAFHGSGSCTENRGCYEFSCVQWSCLATPLKTAGSYHLSAPSFSGSLWGRSIPLLLVLPSCTDVTTTPVTTHVYSMRNPISMASVLAASCTDLVFP